MTTDALPGGQNTTGTNMGAKDLVSLTIYHPNVPLFAEGACHSMDDPSEYEQEGMDYRLLTQSSSTGISESPVVPGTWVATSQNGIKMADSIGYGCGFTIITLLSRTLHNGLVYDFSRAIPLLKNDIPAGYTSLAENCSAGPLCIGELQSAIGPSEARISQEMANGTADSYYQNIINDFYAALGTLRFYSQDPDSSLWPTYQGPDFTIKYPPSWMAQNATFNGSSFVAFVPPQSTRTLVVQWLTTVSTSTETLVEKSLESFTGISVVSTLSGPIYLNNATGTFYLFFGPATSSVGEVKALSFKRGQSETFLFDSVLNATSDEILSTLAFPR